MTSDKRARVLVVDDDPDTRAFQTLVLDVAGYQARGAANGREALDTLRRWRPDAILLDLAMPVMDGWEFRERQRADASLAEIHVLVASPSRTFWSAEAALAPCAMLSTPLNLAELFAELAECLTRRSHRLRPAG